MKQYVFHIRPECRPDTVQAILDLISEYPDADDEALIAYGAAQGSIIGTTVGSPSNFRDNVVKQLRDIGLVQPKRNGLTVKGTAFQELVYAKPALLSEVMHYLLFTAWHPDEPAENCFSWSYAVITKMLWSSITLSINAGQIADDVEASARNNFPGTKPSLGEKSVQGALHWLRTLSPTVVWFQDGKEHFERRSFCPPELFVLAVDYVYQTGNIPYSSNLLLEPNTQEKICQVCLLEPDSFERVMSYATLQFPFLAQGMGGGWGSYLRLERQPELNDLQ